MRRKKDRPPVPVQLDRLEPEGPSGLDPTGRRWSVRTGAIGQALLVARGKSGSARRLDTLAPAPDQVTPPCPVFGTCGGCQLQEMPLEAQRAAKGELVSRLVGFPSRPAEGGPLAYGYRNKLELSFGASRYVSDAERATGAEEGEKGDFLGFHPPGWFGRVVPVRACPLASPAMNAVLAALTEPTPGPAWDNRAHVGAWRHVVLREGQDGVLVTLVTSSEASEEQVRAVAARLEGLPVSGVLWVVNDGVAEVATGQLRAALAGGPELRMRLGGVPLRLSHDSFFQVNLEGAEILLARVGDALFGPGGRGAGGTLLDLYCGVGALGLGLARRREGGRVIGVELSAAAIETARANAAAAGLDGEWHAGAVEEVLPRLSWEEPTWVVVDPPRAGLHPKAARFLADRRAEALVYVACNPASLGRDRVVLEEAGWKLTDLWTVDLFPQTRHVEAVGRFVRA